MVTRKTTRVTATKTSARAAAKPAKPVAQPRKVMPKKAAIAKAVTSSPAKAKAVIAAATEKPKKEKKAKVIRDSFTMPEADYARISGLKKKCVTAGFSAKKSELLRAGLHALDGLSAPALKAAIAKLENVKTGRPLKEKSTGK